jgi:hypothetical protein
MKQKRRQIKLCLSITIAMLTLLMAAQTFAQQNVMSAWETSVQLTNPDNCMFEGPSRILEIQSPSSGFRIEMELFLKSGDPACPAYLPLTGSSTCLINPDYSIAQPCVLVSVIPPTNIIVAGISGNITSDMRSATGTLDITSVSGPYLNVDGTWTAKRSGDALLFPWVVKSDDVTTVVSVVNTAQTWAESQGLPFHNNSIHVEYWAKKSTANDQEEMCEEYNFEVTSSKDDMVTWDIGGHFNAGLPMFNDTSNEVVNNVAPDLTLAVENPRRGFLIVDNATEALLDARTPVDGTMYGEATIIEHKTGAAWGYVAYNGIGGLPYFYDTLDQHGEVIGGITLYYLISEVLPFQEVTQTTLLNPNDAITKFFVTPIGVNQRQGNINSRVQLCRLPEKFPGIGDDPEESAWNGMHHTGECPSGGIWNNEEGGFSFTVKKNVVCTTADNIVDLFGGAGSSAYTQWVASGKAGWAYIMTPIGNLDATAGTENYYEADAAAIGKLEFGTGLSWDGSIADTINTFVWLRDEATAYYKHFDVFGTAWKYVPGGINIIHNEAYKEFEYIPPPTGACCDYPTGCIEDVTEETCFLNNGNIWFQDLPCANCPPPPPPP